MYLRIISRVVLPSLLGLPMTTTTTTIAVTCISMAPHHPRRGGEKEEGGEEQATQVDKIIGFHLMIFTNWIDGERLPIVSNREEGGRCYW